MNPTIAVFLITLVILINHTFPAAIHGAPVELFDPVTPWSYLVASNFAEATSPPHEWRNPAFVEGPEWQSGALPIGYTISANDPLGYEARLVTQLPNSTTADYRAVFLRKEFFVTDSSRFTDVTLGVVVDDGCVAWLNGREIMRFQCCTGGTDASVPTADSRATTGVESAANTNTVANYASGPLLDGTNVLCIALFNVVESSSDLVLDAALTANERLNSAPTLLPISNRSANVGMPLVITNVASDSDLPMQRLSFAFASAAPVGARLTSNGLFRWIPPLAAAGSSNWIMVQVIDDGSPSLAATQSFSILVRDYLSVSLDGAVIQAGQTASVPLRAFSSGPLISVALDLVYSEGTFTNFALASFALPVASGAVNNVSSNRTTIGLTNSPGQSVEGAVQLGTITFECRSDTHSMFSTIAITNILPHFADDTISDVNGNTARIAVISAEPLLEAGLQTNAHPYVTLHGLPGRTYILETNWAFGSQGRWQSNAAFTLVGLSLELTNITGTAGATFYRVREP